MTTPTGKKLTAPLPGKVLAVKVKVGDRVNPGHDLLTLESMKMEVPIKATWNGVITAIKVEIGQTVNTGAVLLEYE